MGKLKQQSAIAGVLVLAIVLGSWFLLISPQHKKVADIKAQTATEQSAIAALQLQIQRLKTDAADLPKAQAALAAVAAKLPANPALPELVHQLTTAAAANHVDLASIAPAAPTALTPTVTGPVTLPSPAASGSSSAAPAAGSSGTAATGAAAAAAGGQLFQVPITVTVGGSYFQVESFVHALENLKRAYLVSQISLAPGDTVGTKAATGTGTASPAPGATAQAGYDGQLTATITGSVFELLTVTPQAAATLPASATPSPSK